MFSRPYNSPGQLFENKVKCIAVSILLQLTLFPSFLLTQANSEPKLFNLGKMSTVISHISCFPPSFEHNLVALLLCPGALSECEAQSYVLPFILALH